jgi:hypothetical protein
MAKGTSGKAGEMNVQFTVTGSEAAKAAADKVKGALHDAGAAGKKMGNDVAEGTKEAEKGVISTMREFVHFAHLLTRVIIPLAIINHIKEIAAGWIEAAEKAEEYNRVLNEMTVESSKKLRDMSASPEDKERNALLDEYSATAQKITKELEKQKKEHEGIWASSLGYFGAQEEIKRLEEEASITQQTELELLTRKLAILDEQEKKKEKIAEHDNNRKLSAMEESIEAENAVKSYELAGDKLGAMREKAAQGVAELEKMKIWAEEYPLLLQQIEQKQTNINRQLEKDVAEFKATKEKEKQAQLDKEAAEMQRLSIEGSRDRLRYEEQITKTMQEQVGIFNLANATFNQGQAAQAGAFGQQWSIASRVGR